MSRRVQTNTDSHLWKWTSESDLHNLDYSAVSHLLDESRQAAIERLAQLFRQGSSAAERNAVASAISTLTELRERADGTRSAIRTRK